jgi:hypothetical protein
MLTYFSTDPGILTVFLITSGPPTEGLYAFPLSSNSYKKLKCLFVWWYNAKYGFVFWV